MGALSRVESQLLQLTRNCKSQDDVKLIIIKMWRKECGLLNGRAMVMLIGGSDEGDDLA
jgi:hypothetical protein